MYDYGEGHIEVVLYRFLRQTGLEDDGGMLDMEDGVLPWPEGLIEVNGCKLEENIRRARRRISELVKANPWEWFFTFTVNDKNFNRYDLEGIYKALSQFFRNYSRDHELKIKYLIVPETHKDGAWHFHGFLMGLPVSHLTRFTKEHTGSKYINEKVAKGEAMYDWLAYANKFGWCDIEHIKNKAKASSYIREYITKDLERSVKEAGKHLFRCSQGLKGRVLVKQGYWIDNDIERAFEYGYDNDFAVKLQIDLTTKDGMMLYESYYERIKPEHDTVPT